MNAVNSIKFGFSKWASRYGLLVLFLVFILVEFNSKLLRYSGDYSDLQKLTKGVFLAIMLVGLAVEFKKNMKLILCLGVLVLVFVVGQIGLSPGYSNYNLITLSRYIFPLVLFGFFNTYRPASTGLNWVFKAFEWLLVLNFVIIVIGFFTETYALKTYLGDRFGYNGLLLTSSTSTYVYFCALGYFYFRYKLELFKNWKFWLVIASCLLAGTKSLYLGLVLFVFMIGLEQFKKYKIQLIVLGSFAFVLGLYVLLYHVPEFAHIRAQQGILSSLLSYRDQLFLENTWPYVDQHWNAINYIVGGVADFTLRTQMDFVDLVFFWGFLGAILYLYIYGTSLFTFKLNQGQWFYFIILGIVVFIAGNFFTYTSIPLYVLLVKEAITSQKING